MLDCVIHKFRLYFLVVSYVWALLYLMNIFNYIDLLLNIFNFRISLSGGSFSVHYLFIIVSTVTSGIEITGLVQELLRFKNSKTKGATYRQNGT